MAVETSPGLSVEPGSWNTTVDLIDSPADQTLRRPALTLSEAAAACGRGRSTIRRYLDADRFPGAFREPGEAGPETGPWRIPLEDLIAAGLTPNRSGPAAGLAHETPLRTAVSGADDEPDWRIRALVAEARLEERAATVVALEGRVGALERMMRMLEPGPLSTGGSAVDTNTETPGLRHETAPQTGMDSSAPGTSPARHGWWARRKRR